ncbi:MAG: cytochrome c maturation protein CcmE [Gammaproteobacteria bacterium]|nr:cytochrome c maturation protein CcmE [Gammaproteobacteria bacterium]MDH5652320.1 cytochrome c maturation protein CcmE [Gammaproteobacteria bacterium]
MRIIPKHAHRRKRLGLILLLLAGVGTSVGFVTMALNENMNHFYSPTEVVDGKAPKNHTFRIGGMVRTGTVKRSNSSLDVNFEVTDTAKNVQVLYTGILPDLFREGQGVVAQGKLNDDGIFVASQVLAKHDETYMPPEAGQAIKDAQKLKASLKE